MLADSFGNALGQHFVNDMAKPTTVAQSNVDSEPDYGVPELDYVESDEGYTGPTQSQLSVAQAPTNPAISSKKYKV